MYKESRDTILVLFRTFQYMNAEKPLKLNEG